MSGRFRIQSPTESYKTLDTQQYRDGLGKKDPAVDWRLVQRALHCTEIGISSDLMCRACLKHLYIVIRRVVGFKTSVIHPEGDIMLCCFCGQQAKNFTIVVK